MCGACTFFPYGFRSHPIHLGIRLHLEKKSNFDTQLVKRNLCYNLKIAIATYNYGRLDWEEEYDQPLQLSVGPFVVSLGHSNQAVPAIVNCAL